MHRLCLSRCRCCCLLAPFPWAVHRARHSIRLSPSPWNTPVEHEDTRSPNNSIEPESPTPQVMIGLYLCSFLLCLFGLPEYSSREISQETDAPPRSSSSQASEQRRRSERVWSIGYLPLCVCFPSRLWLGLPAGHSALLCVHRASAIPTSVLLRPCSDDTDLLTLINLCWGPSSLSAISAPEFASIRWRPNPSPLSSLVPSLDRSLLGCQLQKEAQS